MHENEISGWNVLRTRSRQEKVVEKVLTQKLVTAYLPKLPRKSRSKPIETPIFPGFVFVKPKLEQIYSLNYIPGSCGLLLHRGKPGLVREKELAAIRALVSSSLPFDLHMGLIPGIRVKVVKGPLAGVEGELARAKGSDRLVINAEILGQAVSVEINQFDVAAI
jgi:transcription antitermination factor NusG